MIAGKDWRLQAWAVFVPKESQAGRC